MQEHAQQQNSFRAGIQQKLFFFLGCVAFLFVAAGTYELYTLLRIESETRVITQREIPITQGIKEALVALLEGTAQLDAALAIHDPEELERIRDHEAAFSSAAIRFETFLAAILWGSETEAFRASDGGLNYAEWRRLGLNEELIIQRCCEMQRQQVGIADIHFGAFVGHGLHAVAQHKRLLRLREDAADPDEIAAAERASRRELRAALDDSNTVVSQLSSVVTTSNTAINRAARDIDQGLEQTLRGLSVLLVVGFGIVLAFGYVVIRRAILDPLHALTRVTQEISEGNLNVRAKVHAHDEIGLLAHLFNQMTDRLAAYPKELQQEVEVRTRELHETNERLQELLHEVYVSSKILIRKDREFTRANQELMKLNRELEEVGKILVKRDLELTEANARLEELDVVKSEFVSVAAHQLRTPLTGIRWTLRGLADGEFGLLAPEQQKAAEDGFQATTNAIELINDLLDVARIEGGRYGFSFAEQPLRPVIRQAVKRLRSKAEKKGIRLSLKPVSEDLVAVIDSERLEMALDNALDNAIKYTEPPGTITVSAAREPERERVRISVSDTGIGVPKDQQHRLFSKFFRAQNAVLLQTSGTGLGLYLIKNIIDRHNGKVEIESEEGRGTTMRFYLPLAEAEQPTQEE